MLHCIKRIFLMLLTAVLLLAFGYCVILPRVLPLKYQNLVEKYAAIYGLDKSLVNAVIFCESGFEPDVVSAAGAVGLMQITPETGWWAAAQLGLDAEKLDLTVPEENMRIGCWYLQWLMEKFGGVTETALAGYNAGQGKVEKWLMDMEMSIDGITLDDIPYEETKGYVRKVLLMERLYYYLYQMPFERIGTI